MTNEILYENSTRKINRNIAQKRWRLLARALSHSSEEDNSEEISVRRFTSFDLLRPVYLENEVGYTWWLYRGLIGGELYEVLIRHIGGRFSANELIGFNNTGNVCVWPSEECMAYYLLKNPELCQGRRVLELGGGMSCLAGILAAKYCKPSSMTLTDGNVTSVDNVRCIVERNGMFELVRCAVVQWAFFQDFNGESSKYEVILCADCLFFDETRLDLVDTIYNWLTEDGVALLMAPRRGSTFHKFIQAAMQRGFIVRHSEMYDAEIWSRHLELSATNSDYTPDLHFPLLLKLTKRKETHHRNFELN